MEAMEAPTPIIRECQNNSKEISILINLNNETFNIKVNIWKESLVIKAKNESSIKDNYASYFNYDDLKNISKSMKYFDNINEFFSFIEEKAKKK